MKRRLRIRTGMDELEHSGAEEDESYEGEDGDVQEDVVQDAAEAAAPRKRGARYFVIKPVSMRQIENSERRGVWHTTAGGGTALNAAFDSSSNVYLVASIVRSGGFQGFARMEGPAEGGVLRVDWKCVCELSFDLTRHLRNPLNENKLVKVARDCQELGGDSGPRLLTLIADARRHEDRMAEAQRRAQRASLRQR